MTKLRELKDHLRNQKNSDIKTNPKKEMSQSTRDTEIKEMLGKQSLTVGAAPFRTSQIESVMKKMMDRGVMTEDELHHDRLKSTLKSILKKLVL